MSRREWMRRMRKQQIAAPVRAHATLSSCILAWCACVCVCGSNTRPCGSARAHTLIHPQLVVEVIAQETNKKQKQAPGSDEMKKGRVSKRDETNRHLRALQWLQAEGI